MTIPYQIELLIRARMVLVDRDGADDKECQALISDIDDLLVREKQTELVYAFARAARNDWRNRKRWAFAAADILSNAANETATELAIEADENLASQLRGKEAAK